MRAALAVVAVSLALLAVLYGMHQYATGGAVAHATRAAVLARY